MIVFGPVPSRRLGRSLGINNIPPKSCSYSCVYCQVGQTRKKQAERCAFFMPEKILSEVESRLEKIQQIGERLDYITFVADGEPTLDTNLGREIEVLKTFGYRIAVLTNASLMAQPDVRDNLMLADWVSVKIDAVRGSVWRRMNRPHHTIDLGSVFDGIFEFAASYTGDLVSETMLVPDVNTRDYHLQEIADLLARLRPKTAYLTIPMRPPAERWVRRPSEGVINQAYQLFQEKIERVECLIGDEESTFSATEDVASDLLDIIAVHPMREEAVDTLLGKKDADWSIVRKLIRQGQIVETVYEGRKFYVRKLPVGN
jgi:wyosine [tRNA(Phe)-imidazoG37] synthetase (radical SAM superfamily)